MNRWLPVGLACLLALTACGQSVEKLNNAGNKAFANKDYAGALANYQQAQNKAPAAAQPHYNAANAYYRQQQFDQAQKEIEQTLAKNSGDLTQAGFYNLGNTLYQQKQFDAAIAAYQEALRLNPNDVAAKHNLELALQQQQQQQQKDQQNGQQQQQQKHQQNDQQAQQNNQQQQNDQSRQNQQPAQPADQPQSQPPNNQSQPNGQPVATPVGPEQAQKQPAGQLQTDTGLTPAQARQLFQAAAKGTKSLEEYLQQTLVAPGPPPAEDW